MLADVAPELAEWAAFFAATESKRDAIRAGATSVVSAREADDLVRDAKAFLRLVERAIGFQCSARAPSRRGVELIQRRPASLVSNIRSIGGSNVASL